MSNNQDASINLNVDVEQAKRKLVELREEAEKTDAALTKLQQPVGVPARRQSTIDVP